MTTDEMIRASDRDRERTVGLLGDHFAAGRLDLAEFDSRVTAANAATTMGELAALGTDLPGGVAGRPEAATPNGPADTPPVRAPRPHLAPVHAAWAGWLTVGLVCIAIWVATSVAHGALLGFWPVWVIGPWGAALLLRTLSGQRGVVGPRGVSGPRGGCGWRAPW